MHICGLKYRQVHGNKNFEKYVQYEIKNNEKPLITRRLGSQSEEHDEKVENEYNILGNY